MCQHHNHLRASFLTLFASEHKKEVTVCLAGPLTIRGPVGNELRVAPSMDSYLRVIVQEVSLVSGEVLTGELFGLRLASLDKNPSPSSTTERTDSESDCSS